MRAQRLLAIACGICKVTEKVILLTHLEKCEELYKWDLMFCAAIILDFYSSVFP